MLFAACCGFDLCHKYILYLYLYSQITVSEPELVNGHAQLCAVLHTISHVRVEPVLISYLFRRRVHRSHLRNGERQLRAVRLCPVVRR